jgi:hypothetical protein
MTIPVCSGILKRVGIPHGKKQPLGMTKPRRRRSPIIGWNKGKEVARKQQIPRKARDFGSRLPLLLTPAERLKLPGTAGPSPAKRDWDDNARKLSVSQPALSEVERVLPW